MTEFYSNGTASVVNGSKTVTSVSPAVWIPANVKKGDLFLDGTRINVIATEPVFDDDTGTYSFDLGLNYAGATSASLPYTIIKTSAEWGTNRTLSLQTAELIQGYAVGAITETQLNDAVAAAQAAQIAAETAFDAFDDVYLGAKAADPASDNDGHALVAGQIYFNTTNSKLRLYSGSAWSDMLAGQAGAQGVGAGLQFNLMTSTTDADPGGPGNARINNTDRTAATKVWLDNTDINNASQTGVIDSWDDSTSTTKGLLYIWNRANRAQFVIYAVTGAIVDKTGYREIPVSHVGSAGTISNATQCEFVFIPKGDKGDTGAAGQTAGVPLTFSTTVTDSDPGTGTVRANNATFASITSLFVDNTDANANLITAWLDSLDDRSNANARGYIRLQSPTNPSVFMEFAVTGPVVDGTGYRKVPVSPISGALPANGAALVAVFAPSGQDGTTGQDGTDPGILFNFDTSTTDSNPTAGGLRADNSTLGSAATLFVSKTNRAGNSVATFLATLDDSTNPSVKGTLILTKQSSGAQVAYKVTGITDATGYVKVAVSSGSGAASFSNGDHISLQFAAAGDQGASGAGTGDVNKPVSAPTAHHLAAFADVSGTLLESAGVAISALLAASNNFSDVGNKQTAIDTLFQSGATVTAASTTNLETMAGMFGTVSGNTGISAVTLNEGHWRLVRFSGTPLIAVGSSLVLNNAGANYQVVAGDHILFAGDGSGIVRGIVFPISGYMPGALPAAYMDTDGTLAANSDAKIASQKALKTYVDNVAAGLDIKPSCRAATTANITLSGAQTIDGVSVVAGDRVLVKNQSTASQNGIYVAASGSWTRATDMDAWTEVPGASSWIEEGTTLSDTAWVCTANQGGTIGSTSITFTQFGGTGAFAPLASPAFTGAPTAPTAAVDTNTTQVATTAMVLGQAASAAPLGDAAIAAVGTSTRYARADHVHPGREVLAADRTYYVATNGSDSNTGRATATTGTITFTNGSANIGWTGHGRSVGDVLVFTTTGGVPTNFAAGLPYYVKTVVDANTITVAATSGGTAISAGSAGSGTHTATLVSPFLTIQKAINVAAALDMSTFNVTVQLAGGTYIGAVSVTAAWLGSGTVTLQGDTTTPANCLLSVTSNDAIAVTGFGSRLSVAGVKLATTTSGNGLAAASGGKIIVSGKIEFGACATYHCNVGYLGQIAINANYTISGAASIHWAVVNGVLQISSRTITISGTPAFGSYFAYVDRLGFVEAYSMTYSGSATGTRYVVSNNSVLFTNGAGTTALPGNAAGSTASGGQYT